MSLAARGDDVVVVATTPEDRYGGYPEATSTIVVRPDGTIASHETN
jgi:hypothetical protein